MTLVLSEDDIQYTTYTYGVMSKIEIGLTDKSFAKFNKFHMGNGYKSFNTPFEFYYKNRTLKLYKDCKLLSYNAHRKFIMIRFDEEQVYEMSCNNLIIKKLLFKSLIS